MILGDLLLLFDSELPDKSEDGQQSALRNEYAPDLDNVIDMIAHGHK